MMDTMHVECGDSLDEYRKSVTTNGLDATWESIFDRVEKAGETEFLNVGTFGRLYEDGLTVQDAVAKKRAGKYYTPPDVASVMAEWLDRLPGTEVCDVACGTGNLILSYLERIGMERAVGLVGGGHVHLYDIDRTALRICAFSIGMKYGFEAAKGLNIHLGDFLQDGVDLPADCKVITNPPYGPMDVRSSEERDGPYAAYTPNGDLYAAFMGKTLKSGCPAVLLTPQSFLGGGKFAMLRRSMQCRGGFLVSFDNVPGSIFNGRKMGIFNTNSSNSTRAAITVVEHVGAKTGFRVSPLVRFRSDERDRLLDCGVLESFLGSERQYPGSMGHPFAKCHRELEEVWRKWNEAYDGFLGNMVRDGPESRELFVPTSCRYYTVASPSELHRKGMMRLRFGNAMEYAYAFCLLNSSFAYWHWRMFDGGVSLPFGIVGSIPTFLESLTYSDIAFCEEFSRKMESEWLRWRVYKKNKGMQESVKFPTEYRDRINSVFLRAIGADPNPRVFDVIHSNSAFSVQ